ncbi:MAG: zinc-dependent peptidase [Bradymonadaceae bacterium]|nr:zinc-dependent peptidase [Lujinxingiaceae bacterium]
MFGIVRAWRRRKILSRPFPPTWEAIILRRLPFAKLMDAAEAHRFRARLQLFVFEKHWVGAGGLAISEEMQVVIAGAAARMARNLPLDVYNHLSEVVIYPSDFVNPEDEERNGMAGEAHHFGTVVLSWDGVNEGLAYPNEGFDPALHEFAHVLDVSSGYYDGTPVLHSGKDYEPWAEVMTRRYRELCEAPYDSFLDDYGCEDEAEFFAVATEAFFEMPDIMREQAPDLYAQLRNYYRLDPHQVVDENDHGNCDDQ